MLDRLTSVLYPWRWRLLALSLAPLLPLLFVRHALSGHTPVAIDTFIMKSSFVAIAWMWGLSILAFWFHSSHGVLRRRSLSPARQVLHTAARGAGLVFITAYLLAPLSVFVFK